MKRNICFSIILIFLVKCMVGLASRILCRNDRCHSAWNWLGISPFPYWLTGQGLMMTSADRAKSKVNSGRTLGFEIDKIIQAAQTKAEKKYKDKK